MADKKYEALLKKINLLAKKERNLDNIWSNLSKSELELFYKIKEDKKERDALEAIELLKKENIDFLVLKGISYKNIAKTRGFEDLDIYVRREDILKVKKALEKHKYVCTDWDMRNYYYNKWIHVVFFLPMKIRVEAHYYLCSDSLTKNYKIDPFQDKLKIKYRGVEFFTLNPELQLLELFTHVSNNHAFIIDYKKVHNDAKNILKGYKIDWKKFIKYIEKTRSFDQVYKVLELLSLGKFEKLNIPDKVVKYIYSRCSRLRLSLLSNLDDKFIRNVDSYEKYYLENKKKFLVYRMKNLLRLNFGFNLRFINLLNKYLLLYLLRMELILPPIQEIRNRYKRKGILSYFYYPKYWFDMLKSIF